MPKDTSQNKDLQTLLRYQIIVAQNGRSYTVNNRKNGDLSRVHAHSPQVMAAKLAEGSALYFVSCDFKGDVMKYSDNKFEAVKAYLDVLGVEYRVVLCDILPRHNWKHILRTKDIDFARYDEILTECKSDGKKAADQFHQEAEKAGPRPNRLCEQALEEFVYKITKNANQHRVEQCQKIFSKNKIILWSDFYEERFTFIEEYQVALKACYKQCTEGAQFRGGNVIDNIVYKQEELAINLHIGNMMSQQPVLGFYNEFSKQAEQTSHMMGACRDFGHFEVLDILYVEEAKITQTLLDLKIIKHETNPNDPEKQLAQCVRLFPTMQPSLQKEFVLELLEQSKMQVPSQFGFINSCLKLYKTLPHSLQLPFISALLDHPKKKIAAYSALIRTFSHVISAAFEYEQTGGESNNYPNGPLANEIINGDNQVHSSHDPALLFGTYEKVLFSIQTILKRKGGMGQSLIHYAAHEKIRSSINLVSDSQNSTMLEIVLDAGADPNIQEDIRGISPLWIAMDRGNIQEIKTLVAAGAKIDEKAVLKLEHYKQCPGNKEIKEIITTVEKALAQQKSQRKNKI